MTLSSPWCAPFNVVFDHCVGPHVGRDLNHLVAGERRLRIKARVPDIWVHRAGIVVDDQRDIAGLDHPPRCRPRPQPVSVSKCCTERGGCQYQCVCFHGVSYLRATE